MIEKPEIEEQEKWDTRTKISDTISGFQNNNNNYNKMPERSVGLFGPF